MADNRSRIAVYCTADDNYIHPSIVALESVRRFHPECDYYVIGNERLISRERLATLIEYRIGFVHSDRNELFTSSTWPNTAYLMLFAPEILWDMGYEYSLGLDADVLCVASLDLEDIFARTRGFTGIENQEPRAWNFRNPDLVRQRWQLSDETMAGKNTNTGVVFWNNGAMAAFRLGERCLDCYRIMAEDDNHIHGDQALFALVSVVEPVIPFSVVDYVYNYRLGNRYDIIKPADDVKIFHFTGAKPWHDWKPGSLREFIFRPAWLKYCRMWRSYVAASGLEGLFRKGTRP